MTIAVGMSGGVDSTMAAWLLKQQGHQVLGLTMQIWDGSINLPDAGRSGCYGPGEARDIAAAEAAAKQLGIPHHVIGLTEEYKEWVLDYFRAEYRAGRTPNPCVVCNHRLKFGLLLERAQASGVVFAKFATGHYARVETDATTGLVRLLRGVDPKKDQSYFIARLTQTQLRGLAFPLGAMQKTEVLQLACANGFAEVAAKDESQDFIESEDYSPLFKAGESRPGPIMDTAGKVLGKHRGIIHYTIGQREGLGVASAYRLYVKEIRAATNTIILGQRDEVLTGSCRVADVNWISGTPPPDGTECLARLRYRHTGAAAKLIAEPGGEWRAEFAEPQFAVTPGQAAVFYAGDEVLGGGWIGKSDG
ncbi:MAG: tRNA 2-thiouridine(34) synthase MnmA [Kiritimatiellaeota bacterium]|nr:tRNA 2-thiouridine(34) synthase MnmA [Kiritimatiellota bacterium]